MSCRSLFAVLALSLCVSCVHFNTNSDDPDMAAEEEVVPEAVPDSAVAVVRDTVAPRRRLPTLREQMQRIEERQAAMQEDIAFIKNDLSVLKEEVVQLRNAVTGNKPAAVETEAVKGPIPVERLNKDEEPAPATVLLSDEEVGATTPKKPTRPPAARREERKPASTVIPSDEALERPKPATTTPAAKEPAPVPVSEKYREAMTFIGRKEYDQAVPLLEEVLTDEKNPVTRSNAYYWLGEAAYAGGDFQKAIEHFKHAFSVKASTKADDALVMMAESYRRIGNVEEAKKTYTKLIQVYPQSEFVPRARKMLQML